MKKIFKNIAEMASYLEERENVTPTAVFLNAIKSWRPHPEGTVTTSAKVIYSMEQFKEHIKKAPADKIIEYLESTANSGAFYEGDNFVFENSHGNLVSDSSVEYTISESGVSSLLETVQKPNGGINLDDIQEKFCIPDYIVEEAFK